MSPDFKKYLWDEIFSCIEFLGISHDTLLSMPTYLRKFYITKHNERVRNENEKLKKMNKKATK